MAIDSCDGNRLIKSEIEEDKAKSEKLQRIRV
jgi:hypothetical protein